MTGDALGNLFAKIREDVADDATEPAPKPASSPGARPAGRRTARPRRADAEHLVEAHDLVEVAPVAPEPSWPVSDPVESATLDDPALRQRRDAAVEAAVRALAPRVKRLLQDEQNELLDAVRRKKGRGDAVDALDPEAAQVARWTEAVGPEVDDLYASGRELGGGNGRPAPDGLAEQLVSLVVLPLRKRVVASLESAAREGASEDLPALQRLIASAVGARYREWRGQDLAPALGDLAAWAFARGVFDATPDGALMRWVPAEVEQCPDADDNALEPTRKGRPFPTGQSCPPAHAGCRCLVVPVPAERADRRGAGGH
ncbi:MAG: hypothetical protein ACKOA9_04525 [Actinomycetota bacterium]